MCPISRSDGSRACPRESSPANSLSTSGLQVFKRSDCTARKVYAYGCMHSNATMAWNYLDNCVFVAHRKGRLFDSDFGQYLEDLLPRSNVQRAVVRASEGAPRVDHRALLLRWYKANSVRGAVLTDSVLARGGVTALGWFGVTIRAFPPAQLEQALDYVEIPFEHWPEAKSMINAVIALVDGNRVDVAETRR